MKKAWGVVVAVLSVAALLAVAVYCYILVFGVVAWLWDFSESVTHWVTVVACCLLIIACIRRVRKVDTEEVLLERRVRKVDAEEVLLEKLRADKSRPKSSRHSQAS